MNEPLEFSEIVHAQSDVCGRPGSRSEQPWNQLIPQHLINNVTIAGTKSRVPRTSPSMIQNNSQEAKIR